MQPGPRGVANRLVLATVRVAQQRGHLRDWNGDVSIAATGPLPPRIPLRGPRDVLSGRPPPADTG